MSQDLPIQLLKLAAQRLKPTDWVKFHKIKNESGLPIEFENHRFMMDFYNDMSPLQVMLKAPQIGATVAEIIKTLYCAKIKKWDIIYTLPTQADVNDMAGGKINRIIAQNPVPLGEWVKDHDTVEQKSIGDNIIYYRGTFSNKQAMMVSSDLNVHDEVDASNPDVITQYETRLQAKAGGRRWYFSHPSLAGFGVDLQWQQSDKKEWFINCDHCKKEQLLSWPENIDLIKRIYICQFCKLELSTESRRLGMWKPTSQGIFSGYHVSQLMCPWITAEKIIQDFETKDKQYFYNYILGLPYAGSEDKIDSSTVLKNCIDVVNDQEEPIIIGLDTGLPGHFVIGNKDGVFHYGTLKDGTASTDSYDTIRGFLRRWKKAIVVSDQGGDLTPMRKIQAEFPGRVFLCYYRRDKADKDMIKWGQGDNYGIVTVDRNRMLQMIVEQLKDIGRIRLNGTKEEWIEFAEQFNNLYREFVVSQNNIGKDDPTLYKNQFVWKRMGPDHFVHALLYMLVGLDRFAQMKATIVQPGVLDEIPNPKFNNILIPEDYAA